MSKRWIGVALAFVMLAGLSTVTFAQQPAYLNKPTEIDVNTDTVVIDGNVGFSTSINVLVLNPGRTADEAGAVQHQRTIQAGPDGTFSYKFQINFEGDVQPGEFKVYAKYDRAVAALETSFFYADAQTRTERAAQIVREGAASETALLGFLSDLTDMQTLALDGYPPFAGVDKAGIAKRLLPLLAGIDPDAADVASKLQGAIKQCAALEAFNQSKEALCYAADGTLLYADVLGLDTLDAALDVTLYSDYGTLLSNEGRAQVCAALLGQGYADTAALHKAFMQQVVLKGIAYPAKSGYAHVSRLLSDDNNKRVGLTLKRALTDEDCLALASHKGAYASIQSLQDAIDSLPDPDDGKGGGGGGSGGGGNSGGGKTTSLGGLDISSELVPELQQTTQTTNFGDLGDVQWARDAILALSRDGVVSGVAQGVFAPNDSVTREQLAKMLCLACDLPVGAGDSAFSDAEAGAWYQPYLSAAADAGIVTGYDDGTFGVGRPVTREDLAVMVSRAAGLLGVTLTAQATDFADAAAISDYARDAVAGLTGAGIINGFEDGTFRPAEACTRAQAAKIVYGILSGGEAQ